MKQNTEIIIKGTDENITTAEIKTLLPYNVGDVFYYSERDCPKYYTIQETQLQKIGFSIKLINETITSHKNRVKENHIHLFKVINVNNSTSINFDSKGRDELKIVKTLTVVEYFTIKERIIKWFRRFIK